VHRSAITHVGGEGVLTGDQSRKDLHQQAIGAASDQMIHFEVALPPGEEGFYRPAQLVDQGNLLSRQVKSVGGNPIVFFGQPYSRRHGFPVRSG